MVLYQHWTKYVAMNIRLLNSCIELVAFNETRVEDTIEHLSGPLSFHLITE